jgi:hypothetical protein
MSPSPQAGPWSPAAAADSDHRLARASHGVPRSNDSDSSSSSSTVRAPLTVTFEFPRRPDKCSHGVTQCDSELGMVRLGWPPRAGLGSDSESLGCHGACTGFKLGLILPPSSVVPGFKFQHGIRVPLRLGVRPGSGHGILQASMCRRRASGWSASPRGLGFPQTSSGWPG